MDFCLSNNSDIINTSLYKNKISLSDKFVLYYDDYHVSVYEDRNFIQLFCGILWESTPYDLIYQTNKGELYNGQFYEVCYDKKTHDVRVITDFKEDFPVYYSTCDNIVITTNLLSFNYGHYRENKRWIYDNLCHVSLSYTISPSTNMLIDDRNSCPETIISNVFSIGASGIFTINLHTSVYTIERYHNMYDDVMTSFNNSNRLTTADFKHGVDTILTRNIKKITEVTNNHVICSSNGSDSLTVLSYMRNINEKVKVIGYHDSSQPEMYSFTNDMINLFSLFNEPILIDNNINDVRDSIRNMKYHCPVPTNSIENIHQCDILRANTKISDTIIMGNHGDHVFWHDPLLMLLYYYYNTPYKTSDQISIQTKNFYSHQHFRFDIQAKVIDDNKTVLSKASYEEIISEQLHYRFTYSQIDRKYTNRMIISPFTDMSLCTLLAKCDLETQYSNICNVHTQRELISSDMLKYLNCRKEGGEAQSHQLSSDRFMRLSLLTVKYFIEQWKQI